MGSRWLNTTLVIQVLEGGRQGLLCSHRCERLFKVWDTQDAFITWFWVLELFVLLESYFFFLVGKFQCLRCKLYTGTHSHFFSSSAQCPSVSTMHWKCQLSPHSTWTASQGHQYLDCTPGSPCSCCAECFPPAQSPAWRLLSLLCTFTS